MAVRTYFWQARLLGRRGRLWKRLGGRSDGGFAVGNAGDLYNQDVIRTAYGEEARSVSDEGRRLLLIGSVAHLVRDGDVVCGVGTKGKPIPTAAEAACRVVAVRGPITFDAFAAAGHDMSGVRSQLDPGLLVRFDLPEAPAQRGKVVVVPHYRDRPEFRRIAGRSADVIDIDARPVDVARQIQSAELVYSSSLHGVVFAHALGRPAVLVAPLSAEPLLKYQDYYASVGLPWKDPLSFEEARRSASPTSPVDLRYTQDDFALPALDELRSLGVAD